MPIAPVSIVQKATGKDRKFLAGHAVTRFRHPQANWEVLLLGDAVVAYALQRARRRSIGFTVGADGLSVRAPARVTVAAVDAALREKSGWIFAQAGRGAGTPAAAGACAHRLARWHCSPYLGASAARGVDPAQSAAGRCARVGQSGSCNIGLPCTAQPGQIRDAVQAWLMRSARQHFIGRLDHFALLPQVRWTRLRLSSARAARAAPVRTGSISPQRRLLHYPLTIVDYVVAHELAHLRVMDHSPRFWDTVRTVVLDYAQRLPPAGRACPAVALICY
ncbi:MAG: YgjP-like metallopeptidase domain-containing protein [Burkholderiaceae bacterium]